MLGLRTVLAGSSGYKQDRVGKGKAIEHFGNILSIDKQVGSDAVSANRQHRQLASITAKIERPVPQYTFPGDSGQRWMQ